MFVALTILVPTIVFFVQKESNETEKERKMTAAFQLAEAATERGYWEISQLSSPTAAIPIPGYNFDQEYSDLPNGSYAISIGSDAAKDIIVTGVGRDALKKELREIQVVYSAPQATSNSMFSVGTNELSGHESVEWGPVYSWTGLTGTSGWDWPRFYSLGTIAGWGPSSCSSAPPCTDNVHYWSCSCAPNESMPQLDFNYYKQIAQQEQATLGSAPSGCCQGQYYATNNCNFKGCQDQLGNSVSPSGSVYYADGTDINFDAGQGGNFIVGTVILAGSSSININGNAGTGAYTANVPSTAWKEYCYGGSGGPGWTHFATVGGSGANYGSLCGQGVNSGGTFSNTFPLTNVAVHGLLYDGGDMNLGGSGSTVIHGALIGATQIGGSGNLTIFYDDAVANAIRTTGNPAYSRFSWKELVAIWPPGLP